MLIPRHSEFRGRGNSEAQNGTERNGIPRKSEVLRNSHRTASMIILTSNAIIEILGCRVLCWAGFSSAEWFGTEFRQCASIFFTLNRIPSCFLFRWRIWKGILRVFFYFCINGKEFGVVFSSAEVFGRVFREFVSIFVLRNGIPSCFLFRGRVRNGIPRFSVPRNSQKKPFVPSIRSSAELFFCRKFPTPSSMSVVISQKILLHPPPPHTFRLVWTYSVQCTC